MKMTFKTLSNLLLLLLFNILANAQTVTIYRGGLALTPTYSTLKAALPNTINGDEVRLSAHTFYEYNDTIKTFITIKGTISGGDTTTLDGKGLGAVLFNIASSPLFIDTVIIQDLIITGGNNPALSGGGISNAGFLAIKGNTIIRNNRTRGDGAGISVDAAIFLIGGEGSGASTIKIYNNTADSLTGLGGGLFTQQSNVYITGNVQISNNKAHKGAGIFISRLEKDSIVIDSKSGIIDIKNNHAGYEGGGIYINTTPFSPGHRGIGIVIKGSVNIEGNTAFGKGGGVWNSDSTNFIGPGIKILNNNANGGGGGLYGHTSPYGSYSMLNNVLISGNTTPLKGGGVYVGYSHEMHISNSQIINNQANGTGAASAIQNENIVSINNTRIFNPKPSGARQLEVQNNYQLTSAQCWWGESDTTGLINHNTLFAGASLTLTNWVVANWRINNGVPIGSSSSYPLQATLKLNTGASLSPLSLQMLKGNFSSTLGTFSPTTANISTSHTITSTYTRPSSGLSTLWAVIDADSFKSNSDGLSVKQINRGEFNFQIYPNPTTGELHISNLPAGMTLHIYDATGRIILQRAYLDAQPNLVLQVAQLPAGVYTIKLYNQLDQMGTVQFVKE